MQSAEPVVLASFWWKKNSDGHQSPPTPNRNYTGALLEASKPLRYSPKFFSPALLRSLRSLHEGEKNLA